jgi:putative membrane protein
MGNYLAYLGVYLSYMAVCAGLLAAGLAAYVWVTPYREFKLIQEGNTAASYSLGGTLIGFTLPLASAAAHSVDLADLAVWGAIALAFQVLAFLAVTVAFKGFRLGMEEGKASYGIMLGSLSIAVGILNAGLLTY